MELKEILVKEIFEKYLKPRINKLYTELSKCSQSLFFNDDEALLLNLNKCSALVFTTQDKTGFAGDISIEYTTTMNILTSKGIYLICLSTDNVKLILQTEVNGTDFVDLELYPPIISQFDYNSILNYENYLNIKEENGITYPINFKLINCEEMNRTKKFRPSKNIESLTKEILNQYSLIEIKLS
ncbi:MAG TPA: hypothetical protein PLP33_23640 [Leptospiraceae bacterium]|nr:hypothetical protein [Leptospiraceae bacterium]